MENVRKLPILLDSSRFSELSLHEIHSISKKNQPPVTSQGNDLTREPWNFSFEKLEGTIQQRIWTKLSIVLSLLSVVRTCYFMKPGWISMNNEHHRATTTWTWLKNHEIAVLMNFILHKRRPMWTPSLPR